MHPPNLLQFSFQNFFLSHILKANKHLEIIGHELFYNILRGIRFLLYKKERQK